MFCWITILGGVLIMMGCHDRSEALFYYFRLEDQVPENHLLRLIEKHISFAFVRERLKASYSEMGRPSIDPELLLRIMLIGYLYGITSERKLVEELRMHLAWRWFTGLGFDQEIPHHSTFSKNRHGRFQASKLFEQLFEEIVKQCVEVGLVRGEHLSVDRRLPTGGLRSSGTAGSSNVPGARGFAVSWTNASGNFWLFGGFGFGSAASDTNVLNDLWKYSAGEWTWMSGSNVVSQPGTYGTRGTTAPNNVPGARQDAVSWIDTSGNLWLFGGFGVDSAGAVSVQNDLWKYSAGEWTWMSGANVVSQPGTYGTLGTAAPGNVPGARYYSVGWTDASGNFWLFGGIGVDSNGSDGSLNDLWKYSAGEWTWMGGSNVVNQAGTYGTHGTAASSNVPGARYYSVGWTDASGNLWLWGGIGLDSTGHGGQLNDLWKHSSGEWTWMGGSNVANQAGTYGTQGTATSSNVPGARSAGVSWTDASGNLWLFGGGGYDSTGTAGWLNDLWKYEP